MLAMDVNDDAGILDTRGVFETIASRLAPTEKRQIENICRFIVLWYTNNQQPRSRRVDHKRFEVAS